MLQPDQYFEIAAELKRTCTLHNDAGDQARSFNSGQMFLNSIEFASANLRHLLADIPLTRHESILTDALFSKAIAELDESNGFVLEHATVHDPGGWLITARERPVIFCSFHYGSYRLINYLLARADLKFAVLASRDIWETKRTRFLEYHKEAQAYFAKSATRMDVVNVEAPTAALALARKVRAGWSLLAYVDGDNGVQGVGRHDAKMLRTALLGQPLFARKGVAFLAHFLQVPIVPVICTRAGLIERDVSVHAPVFPSGMRASREAFCRTAVAALYGLLSGYIRNDPGQWERWFDIQTSLDTDAIAANASACEPTAPSLDDISGRVLVFNRERFGFVMHAGRRALLDKDTYRLLSLPVEVLAILESYREPKRIPAGGLSADESDMLRELAARRMLSLVSR